MHDPDATAGTPWGNGDLYVWQPGGRPRRLTTSSAAGAPQWSPDGTQIAFTMAGCPAEADSECASFVEVYVARSDGSEQRQLTFSAASELRSDAPSWSPDGRRIAFVREFDTYSKLAIVSVASGKTTFLRASGFPRQPVWGRRGIAYLEPRSRSRPYDLTIRIADPRTGRSRPFLSPPRGHTFLLIAWSSRGELVALEGSRAHRYGLAQRVAIYSAAGRVISRFDVPVQWNTCGITWSPAGTRLLLAVYRRTNFGRKTRQPDPELYTVDRSGRHWHQLRPGLGLTSCAVSRRRPAATAR